MSLLPAVLVYEARMAMYEVIADTEYRREWLPHLGLIPCWHDAYSRLRDATKYYLRLTM